MAIFNNFYESVTKFNFKYYLTAFRITPINRKKTITDKIQKANIIMSTHFRAGDAI
jgi:hypothetical protein